MKYKILGHDVSIPGEGMELYWDRLSEGEVEASVLNAIDQTLRRCQGVFIDLGAWVGATTLPTSFHADRVISVEPNPRAFSILEKNIKANCPACNLVTAVQVAVATVDGTIKLYPQANDPLRSSATVLPSLPEGFSSGKASPIEVEALSLDSLSKKYEIENVSLIKIDIEGAERALLPHLKSWLARLGFPTVLMESHAHYFSDPKDYTKELLSTMSDDYDHDVINGELGKAPQDGIGGDCVHILFTPR